MPGLVPDRLAHIGWRCALLCVCLCYGAGAQAAGPPVVRAAVVSGNTLFIGGEFTLGSRNNLAAIDLQTGTIRANWLADTDGPVYALAVSANGVNLYVGGAFTQVRTVARQNIAAVTTATGAVTSWNPGADGPVRALARSAGGQILYAGGDFGEIGGAPRSRLASLVPQGAGGATGSDEALPWAPALDAPVHAIALDEAAGRIYAGGEFGGAGGQARAGLAAFSITSAAVLPWNPGLAAGARVRALVRDGTLLYVGGDYAAGPYGRLAVFDTTTAEPVEWDAGVNGEVRALAAVPGAGRLYAGGVFTQAGGQPRSRIAAFRMEDGEGELMAWDPGGDSAIASIEALSLSPDTTALYGGGDFTRLDGDDVAAYFSLNVAAPLTSVSLPGGSYQAPDTVTLDCQARSAPCLRICYRTDGEAPQVPEDCGGPATAIPVANTTLRFFSEDLFGQREPLRAERYVVDNLPPATTISLPAGLYGLAGIEPVVLTCQEDQPDFGCTSYYTLDGSPPGPSSSVYQAPISLAGLFPDPSIPPGEVDPLLHLAGTVTLRVSSIDGAGNVEAPQTRVYQIDLAPPRVTPSRPSGNYVAPQTIGLQCEDGAGSGCAGVFYTLNGTLPQLDEAGEPLPPALRYEAPLALSSATALAVLALDNAGNSTASIIGVYAFTAPSTESTSGVGGVDPMLLVSLLPWLGRRKRPGTRSAG